MGEVFLAEDARLGRKVALKFLPAALARDPDAKARFIHEAKAASALDHPNICTVHDIGEDAEGRMFMVMPRYEGATLKDVLGRNGVTEVIPAAGSGAEAGRAMPPSGDLPVAPRPLPLAQVLDIAAQVAKGLAAAHAKGIVHRDIKPANVFITADGTVKVLDFGIAKLAGSQTKLTKTGSTMGTAAYMSPEQTTGKEVDQRTDIWSLGVILYEMLAGETPFKGEYMQAVAYAILNEEPKPLAKSRPDLPGGLEPVIGRALAKDPKGRYQAMADLASCLKAVAEGTQPIRAAARGLRTGPFSRRTLYLSGAAAVALVIGLLLGLDIAGLRGLIAGRTGGPLIRSLAVLPLANLSGDAGQEYFSDGMTEELITNLAKISSLKVISRTSVMGFKGSRKSLREIADALGVEGVVEGSVQRSGNRVRITAQLINARNDAHLWAERYERDLRNVLEVQSEVATAIAREIRIQITPLERTRLAKARPVNPEAYEDYLKGRFHLNKMTPEGYEKALSYLNQAIAKDPQNPLPYAQLALCYSVIGHDRYPDAFAKAREAARKAEELGGEPAEMYLSFGMIKLYSEWDFKGAEADLRRAIELNPSIGEAQRDYSWYLILVGRWDEALAKIRRAQEVEPLTPLFYADRGWQLWWAGRIDEGIEEARKAIEIDANFAYGLYALGGLYSAKGMTEEAIATMRKAAAADPGWRWGMAWALAKAGRPQEAREELTRSLAAKPPATGGWAGWFLAETYIALGESDEAFHWLEAAYRERHSFLPWLEYNPNYAPLRADPRFQDLVRRVSPPAKETQ